MDVIDTLASVCRVMMFLQKRMEHVHDTKHLMGKAASETRHLVRLMKKSRLYLPHDPLVCMIRDHHSNRLRHIHEQAFKLYKKVYRRRNILVIDERCVQNTRFIVSELMNLCVRVEVYVLTQASTNARSAKIQYAPVKYRASVLDTSNTIISDDDNAEEGDSLVPPRLVRYQLQDGLASRVSKRGFSIKNAPIDCDWNRWACFYNGSDYYTLIAQLSFGEHRMVLYAFRYRDGSTYHDGQVLELKGIPEDADLGCFGVCDESSLVVIYLKKKNKSEFYRFTWSGEWGDQAVCDETTHGVFGVEDGDIVGEADWKRWFVYRSQETRVCVFDLNQGSVFYEHAMDSPDASSWRSISMDPKLEDSDMTCISALHDGHDAWIYRVEHYLD